jgi:hypothetical protein
MREEDSILIESTGMRTYRRQAARDLPNTFHLVSKVILYSSQL